MPKYKSPVYPKPNPEAFRMRMEAFYKKVRLTIWEDATDKPKLGKKHKGRNPAEIRLHERF